MLSRLYIKNYALIEEVEMEFCPGLSIITGETGAGKSILIGALELILGGRASPDLIRGGVPKCVVEGRFEFEERDPTMEKLMDLGVEVEDGELIVKREVSEGGRSRAFANGLSLTTRSLKALGELLVDLHGQHEHQSLLRTERHMEFLDSLGGLAPLAQHVASCYRDTANLERKIGQWREQRRRFQGEQELRNFHLRDILEADPQIGEEEQLEQELRVL